MFDERHVQALAAHRGDPVVTSVYLDVDGRRYPRPADLQAHVAAVLRAGGSGAARWGPDVSAAVADDLRRMREWLGGELPRLTTRGVAMFSDVRQGWFDALPLPVPVRDQVTIAPEPDVVQLLDVLERHHRTLVVLVDRRTARLLRVEPGRVDERPKVVDEPERQADTGVEVGGWERRREEALRRHARRAAAAALDETRAWRPDAVVLAGPADDVAALRPHLDRLVADRVVANMSLPVSASVSDVELAVLEVSRDVEARRERALVDELLERAPVRRKAVLGLSAVMAALTERRVATLVIGRGFRAVGARCPACGHVSPPVCQCPECGTPSTEADDLVEVAIARALAQDAAVEICDGSDLFDRGGIGALVRF